ncbi:MAG: HDOD domain-containing protein [Planctomycetes bacterium]|nr:HDOD domain-containing protein [Planctomycetota bacterium]
MAGTATANDPRNVLRWFIQYLVQRKLCTLEGLRRVALFQGGLDTRIGQLAAIRGYLDARDIVRILMEQADSDLAFGELCVRHGLMTPAQRDDLLRLQKDQFLLFCACMEWAGTLDPDALGRIRREFLDHLAASTERPRPPSGGFPAVEAQPRSAASVRDVLRKVREVAALPEMVQRTLAVLDGADADLDVAARVIEADPVMATQMLRIGNSALFALRGRVTNVRKAVLMLGARGTRQVVLSTAAAGAFAKVGGDCGRRLWTHSILAGRWAAALARARALSEPEDAAVAGIVHEFGTVVLHQYFQGEMAAVERAQARGTSEREAELEAFGLTHAEVGAFLCQQWTFPARVVESVLHHHALPAKLRALNRLDPLAKVVNAACRLADLDPDRFPHEWIALLGEEFVAYHGLTADLLDQLAPDVRRQAEELTSILG